MWDFCVDFKDLYQELSKFDPDQVSLHVKKRHLTYQDSVI